MPWRRKEREHLQTWYLLCWIGLIRFNLLSCSVRVGDEYTYMTVSWVTISWWRHQMETFSSLLAICAGNSPVPGEFPAQRPVTWSFDIFFDLRLNKRLRKQSWGWWFEAPSCPLWCHSNVLRKSPDACYTKPLPEQYWLHSTGPQIAHFIEKYTEFLWKNSFKMSSGNVSHFAQISMSWTIILSKQASDRDHSGYGLNSNITSSFSGQAHTQNDPREIRFRFRNIHSALWPQSEILTKEHRHNHNLFLFTEVPVWPHR